MIRRFALPAIALLSFVVILLVPQTGWLARSLVKMAWLNQGATEIKRLITPPAPAATTPAMEAAWKLNALCTEDRNWSRVDLEQVLESSFFEEAPLDPAYGKEMLGLCAVGERAGPDNAFFPLIRGAIQLAFHKDTGALEALHLAAGKPRFDSYERAEIDSVRQQLHTAGFTRQVMAIQIVQGRQQLWSTNAMQLFRGAMAHALRRQAAGDLRGAMALRKDLRQVNTLLFQDNLYSSPPLIMIAQLAPAQPKTALSLDSSGSQPMGGYGGSGSIRLVSPPVILGPVLPRKERIGCYLAFLREQGYKDEAIAFEKSMALNEAKKVEREAHWDREGMLQAKTYRTAWIVQLGLLLLISVLVTLSCGLLARTLLFTQKIEVAKRGRIGALFVFLVLVPLIGSVWYGPMENTVRFWVENTVHPHYTPGDEEKTWYSDLLWSLERWGGNMQAIAITLAPVWLAQVIGGIWALVKRRPLGEGVIGGVWRASIPIAAVILLVWCGGVVWLTNEEARQLARFSGVLQQAY